MGPEDLVRLGTEALHSAHEALGEDAPHEELAAYVLGTDLETVDAIMHYLVQAVHHHVFESMVTGDMESGMSPSDLIQHTLGVAVPTTIMIVAQLIKHGSGSQSEQTLDKYVATLAAEINVKNMDSEGKPYSDIWPSEYVSEIVTTLDGDATKAFIAGVMCGRSHG